MICAQCQSYINREISALHGETVNMLEYGCDGGDCDNALRKMIDTEEIQKYINDIRL